MAIHSTFPWVTRSRIDRLLGPASSHGCHIAEVTLVRKKGTNQKSLPDGRKWLSGFAVTCLPTQVGGSPSTPGSNTMQRTNEKGKEDIPWVFKQE